MKVILTERVPTLGNIGEIVKVSPGHARNFLFPRHLAVLADASNQKQLDNQKRRLSKKIDAQRKLAVDIQTKIAAITIDLTKKVGANGKLFGSVTNQELASELENRGIKVDRRQIISETAIKSTGTYTIKVKLFTDVEAQFKVKVSMDPKQVEELKAKQLLAEKKAAHDKDKKKKGIEAEGEEVKTAAEGEEGETVEAAESSQAQEVAPQEAKKGARKPKVEAAAAEEKPAVRKPEKKEKTEKIEKKSKKAKSDA
ncbi:MAG: 50S ribosomal protein L9 [Pseudomonadota bacterium]